MKNLIRSFFFIFFFSLVASAAALQAMSPVKSTIAPLNQVVAVNETMELTVSLRGDDFSPVQGHSVVLVPDSVNARVVSVSNGGISGADGKVLFKVVGSEDEAVSFSVYDASAGQMLDLRSRALILSGASGLAANVLMSSVGAASGPVDSLKFEGMPSSVKSGEAVDFTISAYDANSQKVVSYSGKVEFLVIEGSASYVNLPNDYTFVASDLGSHNFSLSLSFLRDGVYTVVARDVADPRIFAEQKFVVGAGSAQSAAGGVTISSPLPGTYSNSVQVISGMADPGANLKLFDADKELAGMRAGVNGSYAFTTPVLTDGKHLFSVASVNDLGTILAVSDSVELMIQSGKPQIKSLVIEPSGVLDAGSVAKVKLTADATLSQVSLNLAGNLFPMTVNRDTGAYEANVPVPANFGDYPLIFILVDDLGNELRSEGDYKISVGGQLAKNASVSSVADVVGLVASPADSRVVLTWELPASTANPIQNYRVYYGETMDQLVDAVDTFTNSNTWYIPNLQNGKTYYFAVLAIDSKGNMSEHFSNIVSAVPNPIVQHVEPVDVQSGVAGSEQINEMNSDVSETGPGLFWLLVISMLSGFFYVQFSRKRLACKRFYPED